MLATGGIAAVATTYLGSDGQPVSSYLNPVLHLNTSAILLLVAGTAIGGLGLADLFAGRRAERKRTEQIRQEAAAAERDRLARPIHDGVLQVLALVQRHGSEMGGPGPELAELAGAQEVALRSLLSGRTAASSGSSRDDLRTALIALASPAIDVAAPADPVMLPARAAGELNAAVLAALDNVRRHAGPAARVWILLEDEGNGVRVTVRDDGAGFGPDRLAEAAAVGRLGVAQSMRGRIADLGGTMTIHSRPGEGTEVEFWVPRRV
jgi:signal transduction histidine kinase